MSQPGTYLNSPRTTPVSPPAKSIHWTPIIIVAVAAGAIISVTDIIRKPVSRPAPISDPAILAVPTPSPVTEPAATPPPTRIVQQPESAPTPAPEPEPVVRRAQEVERIVRRADLAPGQFFAVQMPDGSTPLVRYMGRVANIDHLPKNPNLWEMWSVASTGHSWIYMPQFGRNVWMDP